MSIIFFHIVYIYIYILVITKNLFNSLYTFGIAAGSAQLIARLIFKWGCDGSSGFSEYKQKFSKVEFSDANVFITSLVPLRCLINDVVVWDNPLPSSTRYCRPVRLQLIKETTDVIVSEKNRMSNAITGLCLYSMQLVDGLNINVKYDMVMTMVDGKVLNAITETFSAQRCYLCRRSISEFNNLKAIKNVPIHVDYLMFGITSLHCWIRTYECLIHIAYRLSFMRWSKSGYEKEYNIQKDRIQKEFFKKLGLHVDKPRAGAGNSNDGNTAKRFFHNYEISAMITGIDVDLIKNIRIILIAVSSGEEIDIIQFKKFAYKTAELFVDKYNWYHMPTTLHKLLIHGHEIINKAILPVGRLSEDAQEAMNKEIRRLRSNHSRKDSRENTLRDVFNGLLIASDPVISSFRHGDNQKRKDLPKEVQFLLKNSNDVYENL